LSLEGVADKLAVVGTVLGHVPVKIVDARGGERLSFYHYTGGQGRLELHEGVLVADERVVVAGLVGLAAADRRRVIG